MKVWIRIIISLSIVLVLGFTIWAFFFREKDEVQAYNRTAELIDYKESLGISEKLIDLNRMNYYNGNKDNVIDNTTDVGKEIYRLRAICLSDEKIVGESDGVSYTYDSYRVTDELVNEIIAYYLPYTRTDKVNNKSLSNLKKSIDDNIDKIKALNETLDELIQFQNYITGEANDIQGLKGRYSTLYYKYRETLNSSANLIISLMEYVDISVYSDNLVIDTKSALYDAFARALNVSTSVQPILENDYAHDLHIVMTRITEYEAGEELFGEKYSEYTFLTSYNQLFNKYKDVLNYVFSSKNLEKKQMAAGLNLSNVVQGAQDSVINVVNVLGYEGE